MVNTLGQELHIITAVYQCLTCRHSFVCAESCWSAFVDSGASFIDLLVNVGADSCISLLLYALLEHKLLFHSMRRDLLTSVAEAVTSVSFSISICIDESHRQLACPSCVSAPL